MSNEKLRVLQDMLYRLAAIVLRLPGLEIVAELWKVGQNILQGWIDKGMYEVLEYESALNLRDKRGGWVRKLSETLVD